MFQTQCTTLSSEPGNFSRPLPSKMVIPFRFLQHDLNKGKDTTALFVAGGGRYNLTGNTYKEQLEYCSARDWEGHDFTFNIEIKNDTLVQSGEEKVEAAGVNRVTIEKYIRQSKL